MTRLTSLARAAILGALSRSVFDSGANTFDAVRYHEAIRVGNLLHCHARIARREADLTERYADGGAS